jgi:CheY-like chemotaxis protein/HPt (histidine-containing phosphotransfer) domain-containing protein
MMTLEFHVIDTGMGIPAERLGELFSPFTQVDGSITRRFGGSGLGLAICRQLTELMGGKIAVSSQPGHGSDFYFSAEFRLAGDQLATTHLHNQDRHRDQVYDFSGIRNAAVLLVDDVELNRVVALAFLRQAGVRVDTAVNGQEALERIAEKDYALVLMDIQMPVLDGLSATAQLRANPRYAHLPVLAMTAHAMSGDRERSLEAGMNDHLIKPIDPDTLFAALLRWIPKRDRSSVAAEPVAVPDPDDRMDLHIPALAGIDTARGLVNHMGRPALYLRILTGFNREFGATADDIGAALQGGDFVLARRQAHSVKSAAATIGAMELSQSAKVLEDRYAQGQRADAEFPAFVLALKRVVHSLVGLAEQSGLDLARRVAEPVSREVQLALLDRLDALLRQDDAAAGRLLAEISGSVADPRHQDDLQLMRDLVDEIEYDQALTVLARLRATMAGPAA